MTLASFLPVPESERLNLSYPDAVGSIAEPAFFSQTTAN